MTGFYWLASYPKSGNTWFRAFLCNIGEARHQPSSINSFATGDIASNREWLDDVLGFDTADLTADEIDELRPVVYRWSARQDPHKYRKIHDACVNPGTTRSLCDPSFLQGILYIVRNPLDVAPSFANQLSCTIDQAIERMADMGETFCGSTRGISGQVRQPLLSWSGHVASWIDAACVPVLAIRYEDMHDKALETFSAAARFLNLPSDRDTIDRAIGFSAFKELAAQEASGGFREGLAAGRPFFRRGEYGGWRDTLRVEQVERIVAAHHEMMARFGYLDEALNWLASAGRNAKASA